VQPEKAPGDGYRGYAVGLGDGNGTAAGVALAVEDLGELGALAGAGLSDNYHNRVRLHCHEDLVLVLRDRQR
jgi:hypothetical protein